MLYLLFSLFFPGSISSFSINGTPSPFFYFSLFLFLFIIIYKRFNSPCFHLFMLFNSFPMITFIVLYKQYIYSFLLFLLTFCLYSSLFINFTTPLTFFHSLCSYDSRGSISSSCINGTIPFTFFYVLMFLSSSVFINVTTLLDFSHFLLLFLPSHRLCVCQLSSPPFIYCFHNFPSPGTHAGRSS